MFSEFNRLVTLVYINNLIKKKKKTRKRKIQGKIYIYRREKKKKKKYKGKNTFTEEKKSFIKTWPTSEIEMKLPSSKVCLYSLPL